MPYKILDSVKIQTRDFHGQEVISVWELRDCGNYFLIIKTQENYFPCNISKQGNEKLIRELWKVVRSKGM